MPGIFGLPRLRDLITPGAVPALDAILRPQDVSQAGTNQAISDSRAALSGVTTGNLRFRNAVRYDAPSRRSVIGSRPNGEPLGPIGAVPFDPTQGHSTRAPNVGWSKALAQPGMTSMTANLTADSERPRKVNGYGEQVPEATHFNPEARVPTEAAPRWARYEAAPQRRAGALFDTR